MSYVESINEKYDRIIKDCDSMIYFINECVREVSKLKDDENKLTPVVKQMKLFTGILSSQCEYIKNIRDYEAVAVGEDNNREIYKSFVEHQTVLFNEFNKLILSSNEVIDEVKNNQ